MTKKIGLVDVDGHNFPNLALMKLSSWHKAHGDDVEWVFPFVQYDRIYKSKIFTFTKDDETIYNAEQVIRGVLATTSKADYPKRWNTGEHPITPFTRNTNSLSSSTQEAAYANAVFAL